MKKIYLIFVLLSVLGRAQQPTYYISSGTYLVPSGGLNLVLGKGDMVNHGNYTDANGTFKSAGQIFGYSGGGILSLNNLIMDFKEGELEGTFFVFSPIDVSGILSLSNGSFYSNGKLTLKSTAAKTAMVDQLGSSRGRLNGDVIVERYIPAKRAFRFISSSVSTHTSIYTNWQENGSTTAGFGTHITGTTGANDGFDITLGNNPSLFTFDNIDGNWYAVTNTNVNTLSAGVPYRLMVRGDRTISMATNSPTPTNTTIRQKGAMYQGDLVYPLNTTAGSFNFVGNPYQAPVDMLSVLNMSSNLNSNFYYVWDPTMSTRGAYVTGILASNTNNFTGSSVNNFLQPGQACFVKTNLTAENTSINFSEFNKWLGTTNENVFRKAASNQSSIRLTLYDTNSLRAKEAALDGLLVLFGTDFSNSVDGNDAEKFTNLDESFSTINGSVSLSVESRTTPLDTDIIPLKIAQYRGSNYTIVMKGDNLYGTTAYLYDKHLDTYTSIPSSGTVNYNYTIDSANTSSVASDRFSIKFVGKSLGIDDLVMGGFKMYPNPSKGGRFNLMIPTVSNNAKLSIYNMLGQEVYTTDLESNASNEINSDNSLAPGSYIVKIIDGGKTASEKLIIK